MFGEYFAYFNFARANVVSAEAGVDGYGREASTALDARVLESTNAGNVAVDPERVHGLLGRIPEFEGLAIAIVKRADSGTAGPGIATIGGGHFETLLHEWGHAFGRLGDEYATDLGFPYEGSIEHPNVSLTEDEEQVPWSHWIAAGAPGIGVYEGAEGRVRGVWRPKASGCVMNDSDLFYCEPCREALVLAIYQRVDPLQGWGVKDGSELGAEQELLVSEPVVLEARVLEPASHDLEASWWILPEAEAPELAAETRPRGERGPLAFVAAKPVQERRARGGRTELRVDPRDLASGRWLVLLRVRDTTRAAERSPALGAGGRARALELGARRLDPDPVTEGARPSVGPRAARLALLAAGALFATGGAAVKLSTLSPWGIAGSRAAVASVFLLAVSREARRLHRPMAWLVGCAFAATTILFVLANRQTTAASTVFLQSTAPLYALVLGLVFLGERPGRADVWTMALLAVALALLLARPGEGQESAPSPALGNALAACSGLTWGLTLTGLRRLSRSGEPTLGAVCAGNLLACALAFAVLLATRTPLWNAQAGLADALVILWLGVFQIGLAYVLVGIGVSATPVFLASLFLLVEPVGSVFFAWAVHGEVPSGFALAGGALVIATCVFRALAARNHAT